jgi:antitoxin component YwqK of YwqJK toxin-antitoxin module
MTQKEENAMQGKGLLPFILLLIIGFSASSQSFEIEGKDTINVRDASNQKQGWWKIYNHDEKYQGYEPSDLVEEGEYLNNKKVDVWTKYYPNGNKKHELTFANNVANGYAKIYYRNGQLQEEGIWKMNRWAGLYKYYFENGNLKYEWSYNASGKREGEQKYFHENGVLMYLGDWRQGKEAGELIEYYEDGSIKAKRFFDDGNVVPEKTKNLERGKEFDQNVKKYSGKQAPKQLGRGEIVDGFNKLMNPDGTVSKEGTFKDKKLVDGKVYLYENGKVVSTVIYQGGKRKGEEGVQ